MKNNSPPANRLKIWDKHLSLSSNLKSKEPTLQVVLDALKLTPFYKAFEITVDVPKIYMQEFWVTVSRHHSSLRSKLNGKSHTVNVDNFRDMLKICPKLPGQIFEEPPLEEEFLSFIRDLGHTREIKFLSDVNVNHMHQHGERLQPKTTSVPNVEKLLLWKVFAYLVHQVENKNSKKNNDMYYPRFTKVIVDYFMAKDQAILRRNKMFWHYARDDFMFTIIRVISKHQDTQVYGAILPQHLTNLAMLESEAYKTYLAYATGEKIPKLKYGKNKADSESSPKKKIVTTAKGKRLKTSAKAAKPAKKKQPVKTSKAKAAQKSSDEEDDDEVGLNDNDDDNDNDEDNDDDDDADNQDDDDQEDDGQHYEEHDDVNEQTNSENNGDDFVHPKLSTHDEKDKEEEDLDPRVHTPFNYASTDDEESDEEIQGANVDGEEMDEEDEANELYKDVNINLEGRDTEMTDAPLTIV
ncbi:hypothetical protein Tco_1330907 [Tanacetum coccineum]